MFLVTGKSANGLEYLDKAGTVRRYFRKRGCKPVVLPGVPGSREFMEAYEAAIGTPLERPARHGGPGSVAALIVDYLRGPAFANLKPPSQKSYRIVLDRFGTKHGHRLVRDMPRSKVAAYVHEIGAERPGMANLTKAVLHQLLAHAVRLGYRNDNPVTEIGRYKLGTHHTWTNAQLAAFEARWPLGTRERLAYALLLYTGQRGGDVVRMRRQDIAGGCIAVVQEKTGTALSLPIHPTLAQAMKAGPNKGMHLIGDPNGQPMKRKSLTDMMRRAVKAAGLPPECVAHGLRKAMTRRLADAGASTKQIASISGHKSLKEITRYTEAADQKPLSRAAMDILKTDDGV
jgi:enterobacteria phage integrase